MDRERIGERRGLRLTHFAVKSLSCSDLRENAICNGQGGKRYDWSPLMAKRLKVQGFNLIDCAEHWPRAAVETPLFRTHAFFDGLVRRTGRERGAFDALAARTPLDRYASAAETAEPIAFLMSDAAGQITGANLVADAGMTL